MIRTVKVVMLAALIAVLFLSGCGGADNGGMAESDKSPTPTTNGRVENTPRPSRTREPAVIAQASPTVIVASGWVRPSEWVDLGFQTGGLVAEVAVAPGDRVEAGELLAELDPGGLEYAVAQAEETLTIAETRLAQAKAGARPEELAAAEARLAQAKAWVSEEELGVEEVRAVVSEAEAGVDAAKAAVLQAEAEAGGGEVEVNIAEIEAKVAEAEAKVAEAEAKLEAARAQGMAAHAKVDAARAQRDHEQAQLDLLQAGVPLQDVTVLEAQVRQAEAALARTQVELEKLKLTAPFAGTVVAVEIFPGNTVVVGQTVLVLANLDELHIHADDVDQLSVVDIKPGQEVRVSPDVLPGTQLAGRVVAVPLKSAVRGEEVYYPVVIELVDQDPDLRWGMTVIVEILATP
jgi:HlyD family secretion protein